MKRAAILAALIVMCLASVLWAGYRFLMGESVQQLMFRETSPDAAVEAVVLRKSEGGATVGFSYLVVVRPMSKDVLRGDFPRSDEVVWRSYRVPPQAVRWLEGGILTIVVSAADRERFDSIRHRNVGDLTIRTLAK
jgi:hypothetical protein